MATTDATDQVERNRDDARGESDGPDGRDGRDERDRRRGPLAGTGRDADGSTETASAAVRVGSSGDAGGSGRLWKAVAGVGALSLLGAVAVVVLPGTVVRPVAFAPETVSSMRSLALLLGAFVGMFGLYVAYHRDPGDDSPADSTAAVELPAANPEGSVGLNNDTVGSELDEHLDRIGGMIDGATGDHYRAYQIRRNLSALAVAVVASAADCSESRAREHVARGTWTDDVRAAAFLGGADAPERPLPMRIRDWASGATFDRQVRATVDELAALDAGEWS